MTTFTERANALVREVWEDLQRRSREQELAAIKANPGKHRKTRIMSAGANTGYVYWPAGFRLQGKRRKEVYSFCVSKHRNAAGCFLLWRQVESYKLKRKKWDWVQTQRFDFQSSESKAELRAIAGRKAEKLKLETAHKAAAKLPPVEDEVKQMVAKAIGY